MISESIQTTVYRRLSGYVDIPSLIQVLVTVLDCQYSPTIAREEYVLVQKFILTLIYI